MKSGHEHNRKLENRNEVVQRKDEFQELKKWIELAGQAALEAKVFFQKMRGRYEEEMKRAAQNTLNEYDEIVESLATLETTQQHVLDRVELVEKLVELLTEKESSDEG